MHFHAASFFLFTTLTPSENQRDKHVPSVDCSEHKLMKNFPMFVPDKANLNFWEINHIAPTLKVMQLLADK